MEPPSFVANARPEVCAPEDSARASEDLPRAAGPSLPPSAARPINQAAGLCMARRSLGRVQAERDRRVEFATNFAVIGRRIELSQLHLHGAGPNVLGPRALRQAVQALMVSFDVEEIVIDGGQRVTGAATGPAGTGPRTPKRLHFRRDPP